MPELPEVETVVRCLRPALARKRIAGVVVGAQRMRRAWESEWSLLQNQPRAVQSVARRGKWIVIDLAGGQSLLVHLGMTGRLQAVPRTAPLEPHTHFCFPLTPGRFELRYRDPRRFGSIGLLPTAKLGDFFDAAGLGPEPFDLTPMAFHARISGSARCLKAVLLDQGVLAGVGNIYADEALFLARLHPETRSRDLGILQCKLLVASVRKVLRRAIAKKGSTIRDYFYDENGRGGYQNEFRVYQRYGEPCRRCRTPIARIRLAGRATHFCPKCQA